VGAREKERTTIPPEPRPIKKVPKAARHQEGRADLPAKVPTMRKEKKLSKEYQAVRGKTDSRGGRSRVARVGKGLRDA